jgi:hypothetical protein
MTKIRVPASVAKAIEALEKDGINAEIVPMFGSWIKYVITLPNVDIKEENENIQQPKIQQS